MANRKSVAANIVLNAYDDLFETDESREDKRRERIYEIPLEQIRDMPDHPYKVKDDDNMAELTESVKEHGLLQPVLVRPLEEEDTYGMVSGHRRKRAYELAGLETIPCRVRELTKDEAIIMMVDSNLQREEILPSEKAFAYKMRLDAMNRLPGRPNKENLTPMVSEKRTNELFCEIVGESRETSVIFMLNQNVVLLL